MRARVDAWIDTHPDDPFPVPSYVCETAAAHPVSAARVLVHYLGAMGVAIVDGHLPPLQRPLSTEVQAGLVQALADRAAEPVWCPILRILDLTSASYALESMGIEVPAWALSAPPTQGTSDARQVDTQLDQRHDPDE